MIKLCDRGLGRLPLRAGRGDFLRTRSVFEFSELFGKAFFLGGALREREARFVAQLFGRRLRAEELFLTVGRDARKTKRLTKRREFRAGDRDVFLARPFFGERVLGLERLGARDESGAFEF